MPHHVTAASDLTFRATQRAAQSPPPKSTWPSQAEQLSLVCATGMRRCTDAFERYQQAKWDVQAWDKKMASLRHWPSHPDLLHPDLQASNRRRLEQDRGKQLLRHALAERLYRAYLAQQAEAARCEVVIRALMPPPRLVSLVGGPDAFVRLPELPAPPATQRRVPTLGPAAVTVEQMGGHSLARGLDHQNRLFVAIAFTTLPPPGASPGAAAKTGIVTLHQAEPNASAPWVVLNPDRFTPPGGAWRGNLCPVLPNMAGRSALTGGPDAQVMLAALGALVSTGAVGGYRTAAAQSDL